MIKRLLLSISLFCPMIAFASIPKSHKSKQMSVLKQFTIDYEIPVNLVRSKFYLFTGEGKALSLIVDMEKSTEKTIVLQIPELPTGKYVLQWAIVPVNGDLSEGELKLSLE